VARCSCHFTENKAALTRLTDDCSIRKSRGSPPKAIETLEGAKPPHNLFHRGWSPPCPPSSAAPAWASKREYKAYWNMNF